MAVKTAVNRAEQTRVMYCTIVFIKQRSYSDSLYRVRSGAAAIYALWHTSQHSDLDEDAAISIPLNPKMKSVTPQRTLSISNYAESSDMRV